MISTVDHNLPYDTHNLYDVTFFSNTIHTLLTSDPHYVDSWISDTLRLRTSGLVGLDVEWRPNTQPNMRNPIATLQLCHNNRCLVFQILHAPFIPTSLVSFLRDCDLTFMGVAIENDLEKLLEDYNLYVTNCIDIRYLSAYRLRHPELNQAGLRALSRRVLGKDFEKPQRVTMSRWDNRWLTAEQVQYATVDAFVSFEIGRIV